MNVSPAAAEYDATTSVLQYAAMATQIGNAARAEAPRRTLEARSPKITKRKAADAMNVRCTVARYGSRQLSNAILCLWIRVQCIVCDPSEKLDRRPLWEPLVLATPLLAHSPAMARKVRELADRNEDLEDLRLELLQQVNSLTAEVESAFL